ncbi:Alpha-1,2-mannosidase [Candidatus Sulfopaludibacter sp. SbA4]|nr:Alpha-1,2-mannosidase [Candidatus Sulfopaludibacter sp. SbA4]
MFVFAKRATRYAGVPLLFGFLLLGFQSKLATSDKRPVDYANGLVGTAPLDDPKLIGNAPPPGEELYTGFTSPGAVLPHSSTNLSPINKNLDVAYPAGVNYPYVYPHRTMIGFSSGDSRGAGGGFTIMPVVGDWTVPPERSASFYDKAKEKASPGYYTAFLDDYNTKVEMTATTWTGIFRFTFPATNKAHVILDLGRAGGDVEIVGDRTIRGHRTFAGRGRGGNNFAGSGSFYVAEFSKPFKAFGVFKQAPPAQGASPGRGSMLGNSNVNPGSRTASGPYAGAYLQFATTEGEQVLIKVASGESFEAAENRMAAEEPGWNFDAIRKEAESAWARKLNQIEVKGGTEKQRMLFYSNLLHSLASPRLVARKGEKLTGADGSVKTAEYDRYGAVPFWDTGRNQIVLLTLLEPDTKVDILRSQLDMAKESGYMGVSFHGDHAVFMYLGDWQRGLKFDWEGTYEYLRKNAMDIKGPRRNLQEYLEKGWVSDFIPDRNPSPPYAAGNAGVAKTLEYSWDDYCLATYAKKLGKEDDYQMFLKRAHNYQNVFDSSTGFMRGKTADGNWISPFDPGEPYYNFMMKEASGWSTLWLVPHDVKGLMNLLGGREKFVAKLDEFFTTPYNPKGICRDCTGMIGQYVQGNQPDQQTAYYYDWAGQPWKTQELARRILNEMYGSDKYGLAFPGMDDQGATSSWYVMSALGFYPVDPARPEYIIGSPIFDEATIHLGNGKDLVIVANHNSEKNIYIQSATLNGRPLNKPWFSHTEIVNGGKIVFYMGPTPNKTWGAAPDAAPPSMTP